MREEDCIFCKIANGEIPSRTLYEDENFRVILDLSPASDGHALILPKEHYVNICEMPEDLTGAAFILAKKMATKMIATLNCDGFNIVQNNGETAGQSVFHFHIHLIPRYKTDGQDLNWIPLEKTAEELDTTMKQIIGEL
jgi:histidine triad (HIT) family protein